MTDKTTEFITYCKQIHGDIYDYSNVVYVNNLKEVLIICKDHGEFLQLPKTHKRGNGCIKCGLIKRANSKRSNNNEFIHKSKEIHGDKYDYSKVEYKKAINKVTIICPAHGEFLQTPNGHLDGKGCRPCSTQINANKARKNTEHFINSALKIHNELYDYSKVEYISAMEKVIIICKIHGEFLQSPNSHLSKGNGCLKCSGNYTLTTEEFINKAVAIHHNTYDYSKVVYNTADKKICIVCAIHGEFLQRPNNHLNGQGCNKCGRNMSIFSNDDFIHKAREIHQHTYNYSKSNYTKMNKKVIIICHEHGEFEQTPSNHITHEHGCGKCAGRELSNTEDFISKSNSVHNNKYNYSKVNYIKSNQKVIIICNIHGEFEQTPVGHMQGRGCTYCGIERSKCIQKKEIADFITNAHIRHNNKYDYSKVDYISAKDKIIISCSTHGDFLQTPDSHLRGGGCSKCGNCRNYSKAQIVWLQLLSTMYNIHILHMENEGEYTIPNTKYRADGYCEQTNTIYEFHGDYWHGNPTKYNANAINKTTKCTFGELYQKTITKELAIKEMGFNLIVMWESDWNKINKCIKILQQKFRANIIPII